MMDMRQHSGGALLLNSLDFSPQSALSNDNLFLLDPNLSSSPSMDFGGLNPTFSSQLVSDYSPSFLESTSQNSFGLTMGSSTDCTPVSHRPPMGFYFRQTNGRELQILRQGQTVYNSNKVGKARPQIRIRAFQVMVL